MSSFASRAAIIVAVGVREEDEIKMRRHIQFAVIKINNGIKDYRIYFIKISVTNIELCISKI